MLAVNSAVYSLDCQGQLDSVVAFDYTVHAFLRDSRQTISQKSFKGEETQELYDYVSNLDFDYEDLSVSSSVDNEVGVVASDEVGVALAEDSYEEEDTRTPSQPFVFKIHYNSACVHCSVRDVHASVCSSVVERLVNLQQLSELHLSECPLTEDSVYRIQFGPAYNLKVLRLEKLCLRRLHPSVGRLRSLQELSVSYNRLTDLPLTLRLLRNLRTLDITGNPFFRLPGAVYHLKLNKLIGLAECPLKKDRSSNWEGSGEVWWRKPLAFPGQRDSVDSLQESAVKAAVGMDCWQLELPARYTQQLTTMAETQDLCQGCLKPVRKLTIQHEAHGYTIYAQVAVYCGVRNVPFSFIACSRKCLTLSVSKLEQLNTCQRSVPEFSRLPSCDYELEFVQDLEEFRQKRAQDLLAKTHKNAQPAPPRTEQSKCVVT